MVDHNMSFSSSHDGKRKEASSTVGTNNEIIQNYFFLHIGSSILINSGNLHVYRTKTWNIIKIIQLGYFKTNLTQMDISLNSDDFNTCLSEKVWGCRANGTPFKLFLTCHQS